jgi:hypothetical protein
MMVLNVVIGGRGEEERNTKKLRHKHVMGHKRCLDMMARRTTYM